MQEMFRKAYKRIKRKCWKKKLRLEIKKIGLAYLEEKY